MEGVSESALTRDLYAVSSASLLLRLLVIPGLAPKLALALLFSTAPHPLMPHPLSASSPASHSRQSENKRNSLSRGCALLST